MTKSKQNVNKQTKFKPKLQNFKISLSYEGLTLNDDANDLSIEELKKLYLAKAPDDYLPQK
ncbi:hypothetical protein JQC92_01385 [Shewanella sp. 202IG2-18]|uniref:hypothetical protein n=1 Tax=Parashewanella hymeniacidonis TaxID=2807618 RepID=UPI00195FD2D4|nr:hypothetical protein [Parashewanella hymeniacidonis]MBM7070696.1 hypothetical protein [Parashewanella hymeniacidonis]